MSHKEKTATTPRSHSLDSLKGQPSADISILTSTKIDSTNPKTITDNKRRQAIIPTPHKPKLSHQSLIEQIYNKASSTEKNVIVKEQCVKLEDKEEKQESDIEECMPFVCEQKRLVDNVSSDDIDNSCKKKVLNETLQLKLII